LRRRDLLFSPLVLPILGGCGRDTSTLEGVLRFGLANAPRNLDPRLATDATSERINRLLYSRLVELDDQGLPVPGVAHWEVLSATHYRFVLGDSGRDFWDGTGLQAADVAATYASILEPATASPHRALLSLIREIRVLDADRLEFLLREPDPLFPAYLGIGILPAAALAAALAAGRPFAEEPLGSGPFRMLDRPEPGRLRLERRRDGQVLELITVKDPNVRVMKLLRGEIQMLQNDLSPELVRFLEQRGGTDGSGGSIRVETRPGVNFSYLGFNLADPLTGQLPVRQAVAQAVDRQALVRHLFHGRARLAESLFPPGHWVGHPGLEPHTYDPGAARDRLEALGFTPERPLTLTLKTTSDPFRVRLATAIQAQAAEAGIRIRVQSHDWGTFFGDVKAGRFQLFLLTWVGIRLPDIFRYAFHSASVPPVGANRGRYASGEADRLIEAARARPTLAEQAPIYRALAERLHRDLPCLGLWYEDQVVALRAEVQGYRLAADGNYDGLADLRLQVAGPAGSLA
jgi:peptide/nickel transport system substrate-binding protein